MAEATTHESSAAGTGGAREHPLKRLLDNPWMLLALGVGIPTVSYTFWGLIELLSIAAAKLP